VTLRLPIICVCILSLIFWYWVWQQCLTLACQTLYNLSHIPVFLWFSYFSGRVPHFLASGCNPSTYSLQFSWDERHMPHAQLIVWHRILLGFAHTILLISASWVAGIMGATYHTWFILCILRKMLEKVEGCYPRLLHVYMGLAYI
jgi:hypothetical protein